MRSIRNLTKVLFGLLLLTAQVAGFAGTFMCGNKDKGLSIWRENVGPNKGQCFLFGPDGKRAPIYRTSCAECEAWANEDVACGGWERNGFPRPYADYRTGDENE